jgi:hypothetical protein
LWWFSERFQQVWLFIQFLKKQALLLSRIHINTMGPKMSRVYNLKHTTMQDLTLGRPKWVICDPMSQHFHKFMCLNADNSFMLCVFLNLCIPLVLCNMLTHSLPKSKIVDLIIHA